MLLPLHNRYCQLVGWIIPDDYIYDAKMFLMAYISDNNAWAIKDSHWLGPMNELTCCDRKGKPVAWNETTPVEGYEFIFRPQYMGDNCCIPTRPCLPPHPLPPTPVLRPQTGWSTMSFIEWCSQKDKLEDRKMDPLQIKLAETRKRLADGTLNLHEETEDKISLKK